MKISALETVRCDLFPNLIWVLVHTDAGLTGLGESYFGVGPVESHLHDWVAPKLIGGDPLAIESWPHALGFYLGFANSGAEMRAVSAVDIALWDIWGQAAGYPITQMLGGACRQRVRVYNTCAGPGYMRRSTGIRPHNFGLGQGGDRKVYEDLDAFLNRPDELAHELLEMGIGGMKIWPFDFAAEANQGLWISNQELGTGLKPFEKVRAAVGDRIELKAEMHGLWHLPPARRIAAALKDFDLSWIEDPVRLDHVGDLATYAASCASPVAAGETLGGVAAYRGLIESGAVDVPIFDLCWGGGLTIGRRVATLADAWRLPVAVHDCTGPVALTAAVHFAQWATNVAEQEITRAYYYGWYQDILTALPPIDEGHIRAPEGAGLGVNLRPDFLARPEVHRRKTTVT